MNPEESTLLVLVTLTGSDFLEVQLAAFQRCLPGNTKVVLVDDSRRRPHYSNGERFNPSMAIRRIARDYGATYVRLPQWRHFYRQSVFPRSETLTSNSNPAQRCAVAVQYGFGAIRPRPQDVVLLIDADMAPIRAFDPARFLGSAEIWYRPQERTGESGRVLYPWNGIFLARASSFMGASGFNWDVGEELGLRLDVGGMCSSWLRANLDRSSPLQHLSSEEWEWRRDRPWLPGELHAFLDYDAEVSGGANFSELFEDVFLHLRAGGNWKEDKREVFSRRVQLFVDGLRQLNAIRLNADGADR